MRSKLDEGRIYMHDARAVVRTRNDAHLPKDFALPQSVKSPELLDTIIASWGIQRNVDRLLKTLSIN